MQLTFSLNIEIDRINFFMNNSNKNIINLDIMQAINIILDFKNNLKEREKQPEKNFFIFSSFKQKLIFINFVILKRKH